MVDEGQVVSERQRSANKTYVESLLGGREQSKERKGRVGREKRNEKERVRKLPPQRNSRKREQKRAELAS